MPWGCAVAAGDVEGYAAACEELLEGSAAAAARSRIAALAPTLRWSVAVRPLADWCARHRELPARRPRSDVVRRATRRQYLRILPRTLDEQGPKAAAAQVLRGVRRRLRVP